MPIGGDELGTLLGAYIISGRVANYSALPVASSVPNTFYWVNNPQGTKWLPGSLGGTYYPNGIYASNGTDWEYQSAPFQADQSTVDAGVNTDQFVTPNTLANASKWATKEDYITPSFTNSYYRGDKTFQPLDTSVVPDSTNRRYLTDSQLMIVGNTSGVNTGDETTASIKTKLGVASASQDGYLLQADWNTFNNKQPFITAGTTSQYYRGDKTFQPLDTLAVPENINLYFTASRVLGTLLAGLNTALTGSITSADSILTAFGKLQNSISNKVDKVSSTDNAITRFDGTTGSVQDSLVTVTDNGAMVFPPLSGQAYLRGLLQYDSDNECLSFYNNETDVFMQIGQEIWMRCRNITGSTIANGQAVYVNGSSSGLPTIALANANSATTTVCAGLTTHSIENNTIGYVTVLGTVRGLDTSALSIGNVFLSSTVAGGLTNTAPASPNYRYRVGFVTNVNAATGTIQVTPTTAALGNGTANQLFGMNNAGNAQEVKTISGSSTVTVAHSANTITLTSDEFVSINCQFGATTLSDSTTYFFGALNLAALTATNVSRRFRMPFTGIIQESYFIGLSSIATSSQDCVLSIKNVTTGVSTSLGNVRFDNITTTADFTGLAIAGTKGDQMEVSFVVPVLTTNGSGTVGSITMVIKKT